MSGMVPICSLLELQRRLLTHQSISQMEEWEVLVDSRLLVHRQASKCRAMVYLQLTRNQYYLVLRGSHLLLIQQLALRGLAARLQRLRSNWTRMAIRSRSLDPNVQLKLLRRWASTTGSLKRNSNLISSKRATQVQRTVKWTKLRMMTRMKSRRETLTQRRILLKLQRTSLFKSTIK